MHVSLIVAYDRARGIGRDGRMPWRLPEDMAHFKRTTMGHPIVMGRKTWDSLGRALPGRRNLVVTRNAALRAEGAEVFASLDAALTACAGSAEVFVIGGGEIYAQALPHADRVLATEIDAEFAADTRFPPLPASFVETQRDAHPRTGERPYGFAFVTYERR
ncbi:MAG: dihydrofolate reductase [Betaproteobacteria bacterium]|jgi:dihydrofolate reductase